MNHKPLITRPRAETPTVEDLVAWVLSGRVRIPPFQRPLRWRAQHVVDLFDSLWLGYPVGSLLLWQRPAQAALVELGSLRLPAEARPDALWVVDGQQRLTTLAAVLAHPRPTASSADLFALWFDLENQRFVRPGVAEDVPPTWLPLNRVLDAVALGEWWGESHERTGRSDLYRVALQLGKRIRESRIPIYVVETDEPDALKIIFARLNTAGVGMRETEVFSALHASDGLAGPLDVLQDVCRDARMGALEDTWRLRCLRVVAGERLDQPPRREVDAYRDVVQPTAVALGLALDFLRTDGHIPHLRLLPYRLPLVALTRFFHLHPEPAPATRRLLRRWLWRGIVSQAHKDTGNPALRWLHGAIDADDGRSVVRLLTRVGSPDDTAILSFAQQVARSERAAHSAELRVYGALLAHLGPRQVTTGELIDVGQLLDEHGPNALLKVATGRGDRILHPYLESPVNDLDQASDEIRASHLWTRGADGEERRQRALTTRFHELLCTWSEPGVPDIPDFSSLFADLGEE